MINTTDTLCFDGIFQHIKHYFVNHFFEIFEIKKSVVYKAYLHTEENGACTEKN